MGLGNFKIVIIYLLLSVSLPGSVFGDGDHHHHVEESDSSASAGTTTQTTSSGPTGTVTTVHTTSGDPGAGGHEAFSSILSSISPDLIRTLAGNPQIAQALRSNGIDPNAAAAAAAAGGSIGGGGYDYPPPPGSPGFGGGFGGFPGFGFGPYKSLHVSGSTGVFYPFIEKAIIIFGGGILILLILALLTKAISKGGLFYNWGSSLSEAMSGAASLDVGPIHKSVAGAAALNAGVSGPRPTFSGGPNNMLLNQRVQDGLDQRF